MLLFMFTARPIEALPYAKGCLLFVGWALRQVQTHKWANIEFDPRHTFETKDFKRNHGSTFVNKNRIEDNS